MRERTPIQFRGTERFELVSLLGRGASGAVYEAIDHERGGRVALKILAERSPQAIADFKNEFRYLQEIRHPNLVELRELIYDGGHWLLAMALVHGVDIVSYVWGATGRVEAEAGQLALAASADDDTVREWDLPRARSAWTPAAGGFSEQRLRDSLEQLAHGLVALHAMNKVHRDVKRSNVLVSADGHVTILDFGLVAELDALGSVAQAQILGTPTTMAPEQAALGRVGPASDWYSVGAVLYQALTGRAPFLGSPQEMLEKKRRALPPAPHAIARSAPRDLSELCLELLAVDPERRPRGREVIARLAGRRARAIAGTSALGAESSGPFVGRSRELALLDEAFARVERGAFSAVVIEGESGLGKTSLVQTFLSRLSARSEAYQLFCGRCFERESLPYKAVDGVIDALSARLSQLPEGELAALLPPDAPAIARAFPAFSRLLAPASSRGELIEIEPHAQRLRMFAALRTLLARLALRAPSVIVIDDMQWTDSDSLAVLSALLAPPDAPALLWLFVRRPVVGPASAPLPCEVLHVALGPLSNEESGELVASMLAGGSRAREPDGLRELIDDARGHPLFLRELARRIASELAGPTPRLEDVLSQRLAALTPRARRLLELAAVAGRPIAQSVVADALLANEPPPVATDSDASSRARWADAFDRMAELRHLSLLCTAGPHPNDALEIYHDLVRKSVLARLDGDALKHDHGLLAAALENARTGDAEMLAHHWREAGERERAYTYTVMAADQAAAALAFERAARRYRGALELTVEGDPAFGELQAKLGDALANAGRGLEAAQAYQIAARHAPALEGFRLERLAAEQLLRAGYVEQGIAATSAVLERMGIATPKSRVLTIVSLLWLRLRIGLRGFGYRKRPEHSLSTLERARLDAAWMAGTCLGMFDGIRSAELQCKTTLRALRAGTPLQVLRAHTAEAISLSLTGQRARKRIERLFAVASALSDELAGPEARGWVAVSRGASAFFLGDWAESEEQCALAESIFHERPGASFELASARAFLVWAAMMRGRFAVLDRSPGYVAEAESRGDLYAATYQMTSFSNVAWLSRDDVPEARRMLALAESRWPSEHFNVPRYSNMMAAGLIELYAGTASAGYARIQRDWSALRWGVAFRAQITRFGMRFVRGLCALGTYDERRERACLRDADACARAIAAERVTWGECFAAILRAGVCARRDDELATLDALREAEAKASATGMLLERAIVRHRRGELVGGDEGRALIDEALAFMRAENIKNPPRMLDMLCPKVRWRG